MPVSSMTGFARFEAQTGDIGFAWEMRSVNGKGLDLRLRLPQGLEALEAEIRRTAAAVLVRGNVQISLQMRRSEELPAFSVNRDMLAAILKLSAELVSGGHAGLPSADGILALKGVIEVAEAIDDPALAAERHRDLLAGFATVLDRLARARLDEGLALRAVLEARLTEIDGLVDRAENDPACTPDAIRARLARQVRDLVSTGEPLDPQRLHQEAAILAAKADIREEIDRLRVHTAAARALLGAGGAVGRRLDFLSQEFNRESNTICSKSNATSITAIGIDLKVAVDQFREQVQNIE